MSDLSTQTLYAEAILGKDAEEFLGRDIGRYLLARAEEQEKEAQEKLNRISPWRRRRITELQNEIWRAQSFKNWLAELIVQGHQALQQLEDQHTE